MFLSVNKDDQGVQEIINGLCIELDHMPPHLAIFWSSILWVIHFLVEFLD